MNLIVVLLIYLGVILVLWKLPYYVPFGDADIVWILCRVLQILISIYLIYIILSGDITLKAIIPENSCCRCE